jgi:hypothetical protein
MTKKMGALSCAAAVFTLGLAGCGSGSSDDSNTVTVAGDVPIAYAKRSTAVGMNPTTAESFGAGGDLMVRDKSSNSATEHNITAGYTKNKGDVSDPEVSYDGKKIVFSMNCPPANDPLCTGHWNIWEYDMSGGSLSGGKLTRLTSAASDDVDPAYLPSGGGFVFSSNRQRASVDLPSGTHTYPALDEYEREQVINLYTMDAKGANITQISVNQSHDRNPVVMTTGEIMFSRWDHVGGRNHFKVFTANPDGTNMFVKYGAHSEGNSFLHPREMDPKGAYKGQISSDLMPLSRTHEGGSLVFVDIANYTEQNTPKTTLTAATGGQKQAVTTQPLSFDGGVSRYGRVTTPYPLWDGTDRVLLSFAPCVVSKDGNPISCANLTQAELDRISDMDRTAEAEAADNIKDNVPPVYSVYMFNPAKQTFALVASPPAGFMYTDPIALQPRTEPNVIPAAAADPAAAGNTGLLDVRSVYDTDGLGRMGAAVLSASDLAPGCTTAIPLITPTEDLVHETRSKVADLVSMKDPAKPAYGCSPARFVRVVRAVAPPSSMMGLRSALGETEFEPQQLIGYAPIEPDGSFKLRVPADVPLALSVIDAKGRAFQIHTNWIQVRPGEKRTCDGCHSPRAGAALNSAAIKDTVPAALKTTLAHQAGETMAQTRTRLDPSRLTPSPDMFFVDEWADTTQAGVTARPSISLRYTGNVDAAGNPDPANDLATAVPTKGIVNYPDHIQPLWSRNRGANTCTSCHSDPAKLDLSGTIAGTGRVASYERLMLGDPIIDTATGLPKFHLEEGVPVIDRQPALVNNMASEGDAVGMARKSRLMEILSGQTLMAGSAALATYPTPTLDHSTMLNAAEKRLLAEFIDLGGKYYNDIFASGTTTVAKLTQASFEAQVYPIIKQTCAASCHQAIGSKTGPAVGTDFRQNRYVLTGDAEGDFGVTLSMISNACTPASNFLLSRPSTVPHPAGAVSQTSAVLPVGSANYNAIATWIQGGC